jgi:hypothetical protein
LEPSFNELQVSLRHPPTGTRMQRALGRSATFTKRSIGHLIQNLKIRQLNFFKDRSWRNLSLAAFFREPNA